MACKKKVRNVLMRQNLCTCHPETEGAQIYMKFLREHPELNENDVKLDINSWDEEDDYYGNGGGTFHAAVLYTEREETDDEYNKRLRLEEYKLIDAYVDRFQDLCSMFINDLDVSEGVEYTKNVIRSAFNKGFKKSIQMWL